MKWNLLSEDQQKACFAEAAARIDDKDTIYTKLENKDRGVLFSDIADFALNRPLRLPRAQLAFAMRTNRHLADLFDTLMQAHAILEIPTAAAASSGEVTFRRQIEEDVELSIVQSDADENMVFLRLDVPDHLRPLMRLVVKTEDYLEVIPLDDQYDDETVEVLLDKRTDQYKSIQVEDAQIWLS